MEKLSTLQVEVLKAVIAGESLHSIGLRYHIANTRRIFEIARDKLHYGKGRLPGGCPAHIPFRLEEWRQNPVVSLDCLERHQRACDAADQAFWTTYTEALSSLSRS